MEFAITLMEGGNGMTIYDVNLQQEMRNNPCGDHGDLTHAEKG